ncbi:hypothetical protein ACFL3Q_12890 [Planctomycetota bacterium]
MHFGSGIDDNDFSDGQGHYFTDGSGEVFNNTEDEVALYRGPASVSTIVDFVAYCFNGEYSPSVAHDYAVSSGIWVSGEHFGAFPDQDEVSQQVGVEGESMGRDKDSTDMDRPEDWDATGGKDAVAPTQSR